MASSAPQPRPFVAWTGRSPLTGDPIVLVITTKSHNAKTGPMAQAWILCRDVAPFEALRTGQDAAICGGCPRRGLGREKRTCYVSLFTGPMQIWRTYQEGRYPHVSPIEAAEILAGWALRIAAYGDPAVVPREIWSAILPALSGWTAYTHLWQLADRSLQSWCMASVDSPDEAIRAQLAGWRTFRARTAGQPLLAGEFTCPASDEAGHKTTCLKCQLCRGTMSPANHVAILEHQREAQTTGSAGKYIPIRDALDRGEAVTVEADQHQAKRLMLALRQSFIRRGDARRVSVSALASGRPTFHLEAR